MIQNMIKEGKIVPSEVTIKLLQKAIQENGNDKFLIDGFPRNEENRAAFEKVTEIEPKFVLFFDCPEEEMEKHLLGRNQQLAVIETNLFLNGMSSFHDQHRDMRHDIDNMSYEELLAVEEKMGTVSTALSEEALLKSLTSSIYRPTDESGHDIAWTKMMMSNAVFARKSMLIEMK